MPFEDEDDDEHERLYSAKISPRVGRGEIFGLNRYQSSCYIRVRIPSNTISWGLPAQAAIYCVSSVNFACMIPSSELSRLGANTCPRWRAVCAAGGGI